MPRGASSADQSIFGRLGAVTSSLIVRGSVGRHSDRWLATSGDTAVRTVVLRQRDNRLHVLIEAGDVHVVVLAQFLNERRVLDRVDHLFDAASGLRAFGAVIVGERHALADVDQHGDLRIVNDFARRPPLDAEKEHEQPGERHAPENRQQNADAARQFHRVAAIQDTRPAPRSRRLPRAMTASGKPQVVEVAEPREFVDDPAGAGVGLGEQQVG